MENIEEPFLDAPIPGMSLAAEVGSRPFDNPPQFNTVEEALDYYIPRLTSEDVTNQLLDVVEMGVPLTNIANSMQLSGVMEGKHNVDVGILIMPVLLELMRLLAEEAKIEYNTGLDKDKKIRSSAIDLAVQKLKKEQDKPVEGMKDEEEEEVAETSTVLQEEDEPTGLMARRTS